MRVTTDLTGVAGTTTAGFESVRQVFAEVVEASPGTGAGLAVRHGGEWVVDLWGGYADAARTRPWTEHTLVMPYSVTKPFAAVCLLVLADRGAVGLDDPVARYWPELPGGATLRQLLDHSAGHVVLDEPAPVEAFYDWDLMCRLLERQQPSWTPGAAIGESALFYGHLVGEVVRRVDGRSLGRFLADEVAGPLGLDFHVGVPEGELDRVADLTGFGPDLWADSEPDGLMARALSNPPGALDPEVVNGRSWRTAEIPAVNGHGTARAVAGLYAALADGGLLSPALREAMSGGSAHGTDRVVGDERTWGLGVYVERPEGWGMGGVGGSFGCWSEAGQYAFGFVTGYIADHDRSERLENSVRSCLGLGPV